jgi:hypothetical protein
MNNTVDKNSQNFIDYTSTNAKYIKLMLLVLIVEGILFVSLGIIWFILYSSWLYMLLKLLPLFIILIATYLVYIRELKILKQVIPNALQDFALDDPVYEEARFRLSKDFNKHLKLMLLTFVVIIIVFYGREIYSLILQ